MTRFNGFQRRLIRLEQPQSDPAADSKARHQRWLDAVADYKAHPGWRERSPDGTWRVIDWEPWMGPWPQVQALVDAIEDAEHGIHRRGGKSLETLNTAYAAMMARRPTASQHDAQ